MSKIIIEITNKVNTIVTYISDEGIPYPICNTYNDKFNISKETNKNILIIINAFINQLASTLKSQLKEYMFSNNTLNKPNESE